MKAEDRIQIWKSLELKSVSLKSSTVKVFVSNLDQAPAEEVSSDLAMMAGILDTPLGFKFELAVPVLIQQTATMKVSRSGEPAAWLECEYVLVYASPLPWDAEFGEEFCRHHVLLNILPYIRQWMSQMCAMHDLPKTTIPLYRIQMGNPLPPQKPRKPAS